jgi:hypothetical protein
MRNPLTIASTVTCNHQGVVAVSSAAKLTVNGSAVLVESGVLSKSIVPGTCLTPLHVPPPPPPTSPCTTVVSVLPTSMATKLTAGGMAVLLDSLAGQTDGVCVPPPGTLSAAAGQNKLTAV